MYIINSNADVAVMRLYGVIGYDVNGNEFAKELASLDGRCKRVELRINSSGGNVMDGLSIVSTILSMTIPVHAHIDGLAASMAGVIAVAANEVYMMDYAQFMMHDPVFADSKGDELSDKLKEIITLTKASLQKILSRRGIPEAKIGELMAKETWLSAMQAKEMGICDVVISSQKENLKNIHPALLAARVSAEFKLKTDTMNYQLIAAALGLAASVNEQGIVDAIKKQNAAIEAREKAITDRYIGIGCKNGIVTDNNKERYERLAKADFDLFVEQVTIENAKEPKESRRLSQLIDQSTNNQTKRDAKNWDWYQKNNPEYLRKLEDSNPTEFKRLLDQYEDSL